MRAAALGLGLVLIFMIGVYRLPGLLADLALAIYVLVMMAILALSHATLTLPGIAGFVLSIGMAVDANVLIFERIKEELWNGKTMRAAVRVGFQRAFSAVFDSHFTTIVGAGVLYIIASGRSGFSLAGGMASNGYGAHSPGLYSMPACLTAEVVLTFMFLTIILGATDGRAPKGFAPIAIGLGLTLIHLIGIPVTNLSVNPARSTGPAVFVGGWAVQQLWLFWVAPIAGAIIAGLAYPVIAREPREEKAAKVAA